MPARVTTAWLVPLRGHTFDLEDLPIYLHGSPIQVKKGPDGYHILLPVSLTGPTHERVLELASEFLELLNGAASFLIESYRPVELSQGPYFGVDESGEVAHTFVPLETVEVRCKAGHVTLALNGVAQPDHRAGKVTQVIHAAKGFTAARDALSIIGRVSPSWSELYLVYELVEDNAGSKMYTKGWISKADGERFTWTSNSYTALGRAGRHGKNKGQPPSHPSPSVKEQH